MQASDPSRPRYCFSAYAVPFAANLTKPSIVEIDPIAATVCSPQGGVVSARLDGFNYKEILSVRTAISQISGTWHEKEREFDTVVNIALEGVNILEKFTFDKVVLSMTVKRTVIMNDTGTGWIPSSNLFDYTGTYISGFRVCGEPVTFRMSTDVQRDALKALKSDQVIAAAKGIDSFKGADPKKAKSILDEVMASRILSQGLDARRLLGRLCSLVAGTDGPVYKTLVTGSEGGGDYRTKYANQFFVPGFGKIVIGEVIQNPGHQTVSMFRFELGCGNEGDGRGGNGGGNGDPPWPP